MKNTDIKISIIIPSFNQGEYIEETLLSLTQQTYKNFEIIVIDGGSTDNTIEVIKNYEAKIIYWISEKDGGQSHAINKGLKIASGEIITWLNSDDYYELNTLQTIVNIFADNPEAAIVYGKARLFGDTVKSRIIGLNKDISTNEYLPYMRYPQPSSFLKNTVFNLTGHLNERLHYAMDFELIVKAILLGSKIKRTDHLLSHYRLHKTSKSNNDMEFLREWAIIVHNLFLSLENGKMYADKLEQLGLVTPGHLKKYKNNIDWQNSEVEVIFLQHLNLHYHYNYRVFNYQKCERISTYLKENYTKYYHLNKYYKYNFRLKFVPRFIINFARKLQK